MTVSLQIVGIFYTNSDIDWNAFPGSTVQDVMQYVEKVDSNFSYTTTTTDSGNVIVNSMTYYHPVPFTGRTGAEYPAGTYTLPDPNGSPTTPNSYAVWQYYLADPNNVRQPVPGDQSFTVTTIMDGWSIVWRLVQISNQPVSTPKRFRKLIPQPARESQKLS